MISQPSLQSSLPHPSMLPSSIRFTPGERRAFRPRETDPRTGQPLTVSQWAERYRIVTDGPMPGRWQNMNAPYAVEPMDCWTTPWIREIYLCFAPQVVKTQIAFNCLFYSIDQDPGPAMYVMPDEKVTKRIARNRILPTIKASPRIAGLLSPRYDDTTNLAIRFQNGMNLMMAWATSVAEISSEPVRYAIGDEISKFPKYAGASDKREASPFDLLRVRTNAYPYTKKVLALSSPGAAPCLITELLRYDADEVRRYEVPCMICGHRQIMDDEHIVIMHNIRDPRRIIREKLGRYTCASCGMYWDDYLRNRAVIHGRWIPGQFNDDGIWAPADPVHRPVSVAYHLPSWYSMFMSLSNIAAARIRAEEGPEKKQIYVTQHKAEEYKEVVETKKESDIIAKHRVALASGIVPANAIALTCGIDSHTWGYRFVVYAWIEDTLGFTMQKILHGHLGSLADIEKLIYETRFPVESSNDTMGIWRAAIDTGGNKPGIGATENEKTMTDMIYEWLRNQPRGIVYGVKGASHSQERRVKLTIIDRFPHKNMVIPGGLELHILDTNQFKSILHWRLTRRMKTVENPDGTTREEPETQRILFDNDTDSDFVREILAEELHKKRNGHYEWVRVRSANHYLDATIYAMAAADAEWQPSLKIGTAYVKQERMRRRKALEERSIHGEAVSARHESPSVGRPDMEKLRERLSDRFG